MHTAISDLTWVPDLSKGTMNRGDQLGWKARIVLGEGDTADRAGADWIGPVVGPAEAHYTRSCYRPGISCTVTAVGDTGPGCDLIWSMDDSDLGVDFAALAERDGPFRFPFNDLAERYAPRKWSA